MGLTYTITDSNEFIDANSALLRGEPALHGLHGRLLGNCLGHLVLVLRGHLMLMLVLHRLMLLHACHCGHRDHGGSWGDRCGLFNTVRLLGASH